MSRVKDILASFGTVLVALGFLFILQPSLAAVLPIPRLALVVIGLLAAVEGIRSVQRRRGSDIVGAEPPDPEFGIETDAPGDDFDALIARLSTRRGWIGGDFDRVENRLRTAAITVVAARFGLSKAEARERIEAGSWTDDPVAAAFLGGPTVPQPPLEVRLRMRFGTTPRFQQYAFRTADTIAATWEER
jgi:hypothetical protein